jgi:hypothetical protein
MAYFFTVANTQTVSSPEDTHSNYELSFVAGESVVAYPSEAHISLAV